MVNIFYFWLRKCLLSASYCTGRNSCTLTSILVQSNEVNNDKENAKKKKKVGEASTLAATMLIQVIQFCAGRFSLSFYVHR
ncbi:unnamed protein product [Trifolium pratense]|uniref:Uncharacterized protein n=1 Tax=Trifolium pratense TaxID=57577 RepID=A0ACB0J9L3_TRIPR|nr:unnamed protein product [Trifolium pratense]